MGWKAEADDPVMSTAQLLFHDLYAAVKRAAARAVKAPLLFRDAEYEKRRVVMPVAAAKFTCGCEYLFL